MLRCRNACCTEYYPDASATSWTASLWKPSSAGTENGRCCRTLAGLGATDSVTQVRALCTLIPAVGYLFGMHIDEPLLPWYVPFTPLPSLLPARLQLLQLALGHVLAASARCTAHHAAQPCAYGSRVLDVA